MNKGGKYAIFQGVVFFFRRQFDVSGLKKSRCVILMK